MEKEILDLVVERNRVLEEIIRLNHLAIEEFANLDEVDIKHFFLTRQYMIEALVQVRDKIIAYSMLDWTTFTLNHDYRAEYLLLSKEKDEFLAIIVNQDHALNELLGEQVVEKTA